MSATVSVEFLKCFVDSRGILFEPIEAVDMAEQRNAHVVITTPGQVRGNHRHPRGREVCVVMGPALVRTKDGEGTRDFTVESGVVARFIFPPGAAHAIQNTGSFPQTLVSFNNLPRDPDHPDVEREVLIPSA
ncbi:MAG: hypothetical protein HYR88_04865 [Verrucomicrobia bacterium]|nr:hypothetical protein [Verrucomicrobiota bacterium]MBI3870393.1 hypothetical protein [Verrucomicrobiota bacterium]